MLLLYPTQKASAIHAAPCLQLLGLGFLALAIVQVSTGALQGMGKQLIPVRNLFLGVVVKFALTWSLTAIPAVNIKGAALGNAAAYTIAAVMDVRALRRTTRDSGKYDPDILEAGTLFCYHGIVGSVLLWDLLWVDRT